MRVEEKRTWRFRTATRSLAVVALLSAAACSTYDESEGTFTLIASGGLDAATHGRVRAFHSPLASGTGYIIALDVDTASPPFMGFKTLTIRTKERPAEAARFVNVNVMKEPSNAEKTASVGLNVPSGAVSEWDTDSATVNFKPVGGRHAVAGDFILFVNCDHCDPPKKGSHAVLRGKFETHD